MKVPMKETPDHHDAELVLKVYDLRRETVMRESRNAINAGFLPRGYEDVLAVLQPDHKLNAAFRQTSSYWEMVYGFARHGIVHAEFWAETNGEGLLLFSRVEPHLERLRKDWSPTMFQNAEWIARNTEVGARVLARFRERFRKMLQAG